MGRSNTTTTATVAALSVVAHGLLLLAIDTWGLDEQASAPTARTERANDATGARGALPSPSCEADAALGTAARVLYCAAPGSGGDACVDRALTEFSVARITCTAVALSSEVQLLKPEEIAQIEAEPLLDLLDPERQKEFEEAQAAEVEELFQQEQQRLSQLPPQARDVQIVETTAPEVEEEPDNARYLAEHSNRVERQTVARGSSEAMVERPAPEALRVTEKPREAASKEIPEQPSRTINPDNPNEREGLGELSMRGAPGPKQDAQEARDASKAGDFSGERAADSDTGLFAAKGDSAFAEEAREAREAGGGGGGGGRPLVPNLRPNEEVLERVAGGGSVDAIDDAAAGEITALNTRRWKYASFFNRMKRRIHQEWQPNVVYQRRDPRGNVYGTKDRVTLLRISLSPTGRVTDIVVARPSGVDFLDEEAIRAVRAAQPFPNPPQALVDERSRQIVFNFGFRFEITRGGFRIFRQR